MDVAGDVAEGRVFAERRAAGVGDDDLEVEVDEVVVEELVRLEPLAVALRHADRVGRVALERVLEEHALVRVVAAVRARAARGRRRARALAAAHAAAAVAVAREDRRARGVDRVRVGLAQRDVGHAGCVAEPRVLLFRLLQRLEHSGLVLVD